MRAVVIALRLLLFLFCSSFGWAVSEGHLQFLLQQGQIDSVLKISQDTTQEPFSPGFLRSLALALLRQGIVERDPETQLLTLFGAAVSCHDKAHEILEMGLRSPFFPMQLLAVQGMARLHLDRSEAFLVKAMGSPFPLVRLEALEHLAALQNPMVFSLAEALFYKAPTPLLLFYPPILASVGDKPAIMKLRRFLSDSSLEMRVSALLQIRSLAREDIIPQIRSKLLSASLPEQEASAFVVGALGDTHLVPILKNLALSKDVFVRLSAANALVHLGEEAAFDLIQKEANRNNLYALHLVGQWQDPDSCLPKLLHDADAAVKLNALLASMQMGSSLPVSLCREILLQDPKQRVLTTQQSPGTCFISFASTPTYMIPTPLLPAALANDLGLKTQIFTHMHGQDIDAFLSLADGMVQAGRDELLPSLMTLLQEDGSQKAVAWLQRHVEVLGEPFLRNYSLLTLYRIQKKKEHGLLLREWAKEKNQTFFLQLEQKKSQKDRYVLTPEQTSGLLIQIFETFAAERDSEGIQVLLEAIALGNKKNRYILAGLLLRATE